MRVNQRYGGELNGDTTLQIPHELGEPMKEMAQNDYSKFFEADFYENTFRRNTGMAHFLLTVVLPSYFAESSPENLREYEKPDEDPRKQSPVEEIPLDLPHEAVTRLKEDLEFSRFGSGKRQVTALDEHIIRICAWFVDEYSERAEWTPYEERERTRAN